MMPNDSNNNNNNNNNNNVAQSSKGNLSNALHGTSLLNKFSL